MSHHHEHPAPISDKNLNTAFILGIGLNAAFTLAEFVVGYLYNSLALLSDAGHNLSDVAGLLIALLGMKLAQKAGKASFTYGYKKASILASLINAVLLIIVVLGIIREAVERFTNPPDVSGQIIIIVAAVGVLINAISAFFFFKGQKQDINIKGAFLHLMVDALVSLGVVVSGIIMHYSHWNFIDPLVGVIIAVVILITTWGLFKESLRLTIDAVPSDIDIEKIRLELNAFEGVESVHHIHIWALSSTVNAFSGHIEIKNKNFDDWEKIKTQVKQYLRGIGIQHVTLELEAEEACDNPDC